MDKLLVKSDRNPDYPADSMWDNCSHVWKEHDNEYSNALVECINCHCPGELDIFNLSVYWPTT